MKKMRIIIGRDGKTTIKVEGAVGEECLAFTKAMEQAIGNVEQRELTEEYHQEARLTAEQREEVTL